MIKYFFSQKLADAKVFLPLLIAFHVAKIVAQAVSIKHCNHFFVAGEQSLGLYVVQKNMNFRSCIYSLHASFPKTVLKLCGSVSLFLFQIDLRYKCCRQ